MDDAGHRRCVGPRWRAVTARSAGAFADGLGSARVLPAMKHFPGIGSVTADTDRNVVTVTASAAELDPGLEPFQSAIADGLPMIMLSDATYTAYDPDAAAGWSEAIGLDLLRAELGFTGVTITDSLEGTAHARGVSVTSLARRSATAGTDLLLLTGSEPATARVYADLLRDAEDGTIPSRPCAIRTIASATGGPGSVTEVGKMPSGRVRRGRCVRR